MRLTKGAVAGVAFLGLALVVGAADGDTAKKLVGKWEVTKAEGAPPGATVEFTKDGKMMLRAKVGDKEIAIDGTYKLKGQNIVSTLSFGGKTKTDNGKIARLTDKELVVEDEKGKREEYKRVK